MSLLVSNLVHWLNIRLQLKDGLYQFIAGRFKARTVKMQCVVHLRVSPAA